MSDRSWMYRKVGEKTTSVAEFMNGILEFLDFACANSKSDGGLIRCPSTKCDFSKFETREHVHMCLLKHGFRKNYTRWTRHGEPPIHEETIHVQDKENMHWEREMILEAAGPEYDECYDYNQERCGSDNYTPRGGSNKFYEMLQAADEPLWEGCKRYTKLSAITRLLQLKSEYNMTDRNTDAILTYIKELLPEDDKMPDSYYRIKAFVKNLGLSYEKIDV